MANNLEEQSPETPRTVVKPEKEEPLVSSLQSAQPSEEPTQPPPPPSQNKASKSPPYFGDANIDGWGIMDDYEDKKRFQVKNSKKIKLNKMQKIPFAQEKQASSERGI